MGNCGERIGKARRLSTTTRAGLAPGAGMPCRAVSRWPAGASGRYPCRLAAHSGAAHDRGEPVEFLSEYAGFLARTVTVLVAVLVVLLAVALLRGRERRSSGHLEVHRLNDFYQALRDLHFKSDLI